MKGLSLNIVTVVNVFLFIFRLIYIYSTVKMCVHLGRRCICTLVSLAMTVYLGNIGDADVY